MDCGCCDKGEAEDERGDSETVRRVHGHRVRGKLCRRSGRASAARWNFGGS